MEIYLEQLHKLVEIVLETLSFVFPDSCTSALKCSIAPLKGIWEDAKQNACAILNTFFQTLLKNSAHIVDLKPLSLPSAFGGTLSLSLVAESIQPRAPNY